MSEYSLFYRFLRQVYRLFNRRYKIIGEKTDEPCIYICRHNSNSAPSATLGNFDFFVRPWILSVFFTYKDAFHQFYSYTFTQRFHLGKIFGALCSAVCAPFISALANGSRGVSVHRGSAAAIKTVRETMEGLERGESFIIFVDKNYASKDDGLGEIYKGFLAVEKLRFHKFGVHTPFVPIYIDREAHLMKFQEPLYFRENTDFSSEMQYVADKIRIACSQFDPID